jgi:hypothetical protein
MTTGGVAVVTCHIRYRPKDDTRAEASVVPVEAPAPGDAINQACRSARGTRPHFGGALRKLQWPLRRSQRLRLGDCCAPELASSQTGSGEPLRRRHARYSYRRAASFSRSRSASSWLMSMPRSCRCGRVRNCWRNRVNSKLLVTASPSSMSPTKPTSRCNRMMTDRGKPPSKDCSAPLGLTVGGGIVFATHNPKRLHVTSNNQAEFGVRMSVKGTKLSRSGEKPETVVSLRPSTSVR